MIMCIGSLFEDTHPDHEIHTERYHAVARAALSSHSIVHHRSCTTVQALFLLNIYKYIIPRPSPEYRWLMSGICARQVQPMICSELRLMSCPGLHKQWVFVSDRSD
jgi:hypothetical protein